MAFTAVDVIGIVATFLIMCAAIPQGVKIIREKNAYGVSLTMWYISITLNVALFMYGALSDYLSMVIGGAVNGVAATALATAITYYNNRRNVAMPVSYFLSLISITLLTSLFVNNSIEKYVYLTLIAASLALNALPQVWKSWKNFTQHHPTNLSTATFTLLFTGQSLWTVYSWIQEDIPLTLINLFSALTSITIITLEQLNKRKRKISTPAR